MNHKRYRSSFIITAILYSSFVVMFAYSFDKNISMKQEPKKSEEIVNFTIIEQIPFIKPTPKPQQKIVKKVEPKIEKIVKKEPMPIVKPTPKKIITKKTLKIAKKKPIQKTIVKKKIKEETKKVIQKQKVLAHTQIKKTISKKVEKKSIDKEVIKAKQNIYYTKIKQTIDKNKSYPKVAVRRGIQGDVKINFTISKEGHLLSFKIIDGKKIFLKSITKAIKNSFPIKPPQNLFTSNLDLSVTLQYKLY